MRFAPGFFDPDQEDYWSYILIWIAEDPIDPTAEKLANWIEQYYDELGRLVIQTRGNANTADLQPVRARFAEVSDPNGPRFRGAIAMYELFADYAPIALNAGVHLCGAKKLIIEISPHRFDTHEIWTRLDQQRLLVDCR